MGSKVKNQSIYAERIETGRKIMRNSSVAICLLARDCEESLTKNIHFIEELRQYFKESFVVVVENDSRDGTKSILKKWEKESHHLTLYSMELNLETHPRFPKKQFMHYAFSMDRINRMAKFRNIYLQHVRENLNVDFLIAIDFDVYEIDLKGIINSFGFEKKWDCIISNGKKITAQNLFCRYFYDAYAFKEKSDDLPVTLKAMRHIQKKYRNLTAGMDLMRVRSGFNAMGIYRWEAIKALAYRVKGNPDPLVTCQCEHLTFHDDMATRGFDKIYLNPSQLVLYENTSLRWYLKMARIKIKDMIFQLWTDKTADVFVPGRTEVL